MARKCDAESPKAKSALDQISTRWSVVNEPVQFLVRYSRAIRRYVETLIKNPHDAEELLQEFLMRVVEHGFVRASPDRGRFRDYLKKALRNAALNHLRRKKTVQPDEFALVQFPDPDAHLRADQEWNANWQRCVLDKAWRALDIHQRQSPGNLFYTVLRAAADYPEDDSKTLAARTSETAGRPIGADAFRKQLSRARRRFAEILLQEVAQTLDHPTPDQIEEELIELGLMEYVRDFLPADWRSQPR